MYFNCYNIHRQQHLLLVTTREFIDPRTPPVILSKVNNETLDWPGWRGDIILFSVLERETFRESDDVVR